MGSAMMLAGLALWSVRRKTLFSMLALYAPLPPVLP